MSRNAASEAQVRAADPANSTWLTANAGSGKTRVLTDRVTRLLLGGTDPQRILCLTYTKAAASEMQNRLFRRLGEWAMLPEDRLRAELSELGIDGQIDVDTLTRARRLFARAIETPGGLKIQTIHSFCAALLRRFPLEARVSPDFTEMDERSALLMRQEILDEMAAGDTQEAVDALASLSSGDDLSSLLSEICGHAPAFAGPLPDFLAEQDLPAGYDAATLLAETFAGGEAELFAALLPMLAESSASDVRDGRKLADIPLSPPTLTTLEMLESTLLFGKAAAAPFGARIDKFPTKAVAEGPALTLMPALHALMKRVEAARPRRIALRAAGQAALLHRFARAFLPRYAARKAAQGLLDFDDLIHRSADLLADRSVAAWVLFRLDGGIDHVLVDEAQDTSPRQWEVIGHLTEEFTAGEGARDTARTLFVVGDKKQSIYSFQGADLVIFDRVRDDVQQRREAAGAPFQAADLIHSFRSAPAILDLVDRIFAADAATGLGGPTRHSAFHETMPGRIDIWPVIESEDKTEPGDWSDPVDLLPPAHPSVQLAGKIAGEIRRLIDAGTQIADSKGRVRPLHEGDFLILVQRRSALFQEIIRACKAQGLKVAGADRLRLAAELAVKDLTALLSFLSTPEDDLSLASVLRSPLFGLSEGQLFDLARNRPERTFLWQALRARAEEFPAVMAVLRDLRDKADYLRPYELLERMLTRHGGRAAILARLGQEAEDGLDAFLAEALAYEAAAVPSLSGFLDWIMAGEIEVKRRLDAAGGAIRVMTVHGAKGLEAPVVILPDTAKRRPSNHARLIKADNGLPLWRAPAAESPEKVRAVLSREAEAAEGESMRLLYVALTRAESWLIVAAAGDVGKAPGDSWYGLIADAAAAAGAAPADPSGAPWPFGPGHRLSSGEWPAEADAPSAARAGVRTTAPEWVDRPAARGAPRAVPLSPSDLGGAKAIGGAAGLDEEEAKRVGALLHLFLEHLPATPAAGRRAVAERLAREAPLSAETEPLFDLALRLVDAPSLSWIFAPCTLAEVELAVPLADLGGRVLHGVIDRLVVTPDRVTAIDFKSNRTVPDRPVAVPEGILRQMGAYHAMLSALYPGRAIDVAILWTATGELMALPPNIVMSAMQNATLP